MVKKPHYLLISIFTAGLFFSSLFTIYAQEEEDFWGGPTTPFTKPGNAGSVNKWGTPLQRKFSRILTHAIYDSTWDLKEWGEFGAKHDFKAFIKVRTDDKLYPQSAQILEPDEPDTYPPQTSDNFFLSPSRPFKRFIDFIHTRGGLITGAVDCDFTDIRDSWWVKYFPDMFRQPGKINFKDEGGRRYQIHYALAQVAAGCDIVWYESQASYTSSNPGFTSDDWVNMFKETKDYVYKAYRKDVPVGGIGAHNKGADYQADPLLEYFYTPSNNLYEGRPMFVKGDGTAHTEFSSSKSISHLDCSQSKLPYLHMSTFGVGNLLNKDERVGAWAQEDLKALNLNYPGPLDNGTTYGVPIFAFMNWPLPLSDFITNISPEEQINFFYGMVPEMLAVGWRFCFPLNVYIKDKVTPSKEGQAEIFSAVSAQEINPKINVYSKLKKLVDFYNNYSSLYQQQIVQWNENPREHAIEKINTVPITFIKAEKISYVINEYRDSPYFASVHLINHLYEDYKIREQTDFSVEIPVKFKPLSISMVSPDMEDFNTEVELTFIYKEGSVVVRIPRIVYYNLILIEGRPFTPTEEKEIFSSSSLSKQEE